MRRLTLSLLAVLTLLATCSVGTSPTMAIESTPVTGLKQGDPIGAFRVVKVGGATEDGVEAGDDLCYRCRYGSSPMVMIFARQTSPKAIELAKKLDLAIAANESLRLRGLFTFIGDDAAKLKQRAEAFVSASSVKHVPVVLADDAQDGPLDYRIKPSDEVTIVIAQDSQVVATHVSTADSIDVDAVMSDVTKMLQ